MQRTATSLITLIALIVAILVLPSSASAKIVYTCGFNVCTANDTGGAVAKLTKDGSKTKQYTFPAISRNGKAMAYGEGSDVYIGRNKAKPKKQAKTYWGSPLGFTRLSPDGTLIAFNEFAYFPSIQAYTTAYPTSTKGAAPSSSASGVFVPGLGFNKRNLLIHNDRYGTSACLVPLTDRGCKTTTPTVAVLPQALVDQGYEFGPTFDISPNGKLLVAGLRGYGTGATELPELIATFNTSGGALVKKLTPAAANAYPTFSPGGNKVIFECGPSICVVGANGGKVKTLIKKGAYPTWGVG